MCRALILATIGLCAMSNPMGASAECTLGLERIASGFARPVGLACPRNGGDRLFVLEQHTGRIKILDLGTNTVLAAPFLDIDGLAGGNEQGLLGMAFHPDYETNRLFFVNITVAGGSSGNGVTQIRRYRASATDPNLADPSTMAVIMSYDQPYSNHNGGWMGFGPDGYLYIASGDGGSGNDPGNRAQDRTSLFGKIIRIDVDHNCEVDFSDFSHLSQSWHADCSIPDWCFGRDLNNSGHVDFNDVHVFADNWLVGK